MTTRPLFNKNYALSAMAVLMIIGLLSFWFFNNYEKKELQINTGLSPEARQNPLLAATRFLHQLGMEVESYRGRDLLINLPSVKDTIFLYRQAGALSPTQMDALYGWMEAGGHLIVSPRKTTLQGDNPRESNDITWRVGVKLRSRTANSDCGCPSKDAIPENQNDDTDVAPSEKNAPSHSTENTPDTTRHPYEMIAADVDGVLVNIVFPRDLYLDKGTSSPVFSIDALESEGAYLLQYRIGSGKMTVLTKSRMFSNFGPSMIEPVSKKNKVWIDHGIDEYGRSWLLAWLVRDSRKTWLLYSSNMDGILTLLCRHAPQLLISLAGLILFFLWSCQFRMGALRDLKENPRRHILSHIDGVGYFNWELDQAKTLLARVRDPVFRYWSRRTPGAQEKGIDPSVVARVSGLIETEVRIGLYQPVQNEQDLIRVSRCLQKLCQANTTRKGRPSVTAPD